jgi:hypothetical protein
MAKPDVIASLVPMRKSWIRRIISFPPKWLQQTKIFGNASALRAGGFRPSMHNW